MNLDQIEQQLNDQAADLRATDARLTALEADARLESQLERLLAEMEAATGCDDADADLLLAKWDAVQKV